MTGSVLRKLRRLGEMGPEEIRIRCAETLLRTQERLELLLPVEDGEPLAARLPEAAGADPGAPFAATLDHQAAGRFYLPPDPVDLRRLAEEIARDFPGDLARLRDEADALVEHRFQLLGHGEVCCGPEIDWHRDPLTGARWPLRFWADYQLVDVPLPGDPKRVCELSRHQHLPRLALAGLLLGDERYPREALDQMRDWIRANPRRQGIHWNSSLEIALRVLSWLWTLFLVRGCPLWAEEAAEGRIEEIGQSLFDQLDHVAAHLSVVSSPNTHLLGEAAALAVAGQVFADCRGSEAWRRRGEEILLAELEHQVELDGVHSELSTCYHCYALDFSLQVLALTRANGDRWPERAEEMLGRMLEFVYQVVRPDGTLPLLGDDDGGRALALDAPSYRDPADLLAIGAALLDRDDLRPPAGRSGTFPRWLLARCGPVALGHRPGSGPLQRSFPQGGYHVQRADWSPSAGHLVFDCGSLGEIGGGHGHADALAITLFAEGRDLLVDPGTFIYGGDRDERDAYRSTRAHNTVVVDGRDQSEPAGTFSWQRAARTRLLASAAYEGLDYLAGEHDGYAGLGVVHRRRVLFVRPDCWLVVDDFRGAGRHGFEVLHHLAPEARVEEVECDGRSGRARIVNGPAGLDVAVFATAPLELPGPLPTAGVSERYGGRRTAAVLGARVEGEVPVAVVTVLRPTTSEALGRLAPIRPVPTTDGEDDRFPGRIAVEWARPGGTDTLLVAADPASSTFAGDLRGRGHLFWLRSDSEGPRRLLAVDATECDFRGRPLLARRVPVTHFCRFDDARSRPVVQSSRTAVGPESVLPVPVPNPSRQESPLHVWHRWNPRV